MLPSIIIILYSLLSIAGSSIAFRNNFSRWKLPQRLSIMLFGFVHCLFLAIGITALFTTIPVFLLIIIMVLIIISRVINGRFLYGKNNWRHYFISIPILGIIFILYVFGW
ncbi:hypothetical protein WMZ97_00695 [Lentibacillus sp. N15]|uniref:hypothetical protein n=1 Tax=Lentibacillus songyuanensis TaxID=3136161 RepID=UPI0031BA1DD1